MMTVGKIRIRTKRFVSLLMMLWTMMSFSFIHCNDVIDHFDNIIDDHNIHSHDEKIDTSIIASMVRAEQHPLENDRHKGRSLLYNNDDIDDDTNHRIDNVHVESMNHIFKSNHNRHRIMTDNDVSSQLSPIHHHSEKIEEISDLLYSEQRPVFNHSTVKPLLYYDNDDENTNHRVDVANLKSLKDGINRKTHDIMLTGDDRALQVSTIACVRNEADIRFAVSNAPNFSSTSTKVDLCSSHIFINASKLNRLGYHGILIEDKFLEFSCIVANATHNCILDMQSLSRLFMVRNSTLVFYDIDFINGNGNKDSNYSNAGVFYADKSTNMKMIDCGFLNNTASYGGTMIIFDSAVKIIASNNRTILSIVRNNVAINNGGFFEASNSIIDIYKYNFLNNRAAYGGAISIWNSVLNLSGSVNSTLVSSVQSNVAINHGGFIYATNTILKIFNYNFINNTAASGGAIIIWNSTVELIGRNDSTFLSVIQNNEATKTGGFIEARDTIIDIYNYQFLNNEAANGGAIFSFNSTVKLFGRNGSTLPSVVQNNVATEFGGFIYAGYSIIDIYNYHFISNTAAIFGGAIFSFSSVAKLSGSDNAILPSVIKNNVAKKFGGFLWAKNSVIDVYNYNSINNTASDGGVIMTFNSTVKLIGNGNSIVPSVVRDNVAKMLGGFLCAFNSVIDIYNYNSIKNTAEFGGMIMIFKSVLTLVGSMNHLIPTIYENNVATQAGGAIYGDKNSTIIITQGYFMFQNNVAGMSGGAIFLSNCITMLANSVFENNFADVFGGAIFAGTVANSSFCSVFENKSADVIDCDIFDDADANTSFSQTSTIYMKNVALSNNTALVSKDSIALADTKLSIAKVIFSRTSYDVDGCDLLVGNFDEDNNGWKISQINLPSSPPPQKIKPTEQESCVATSNDLQEAVNNCVTTTFGKSCNIDVCEGRLQMNTSSREGINISNKNIILNCQKLCPTKRCVIDGLGKYRMFYGSSYNLTIQNFIFINGFHHSTGGSIWAIQNSAITVVNCSFVNNSAIFGSAVVVNNSSLTIVGLETSIVNNTGIGPPIQVLSSTFNISNAIFAGNNISKYDAAVLLFDSTIYVSDVHVLSSKTRTVDNCDVFVAVYGDDFGKKYSCMHIEKTNKSFPIIDVSDGCVTTSPVTTTPMPSPMSSTTKTSQPVTAPSSTTCFSGENLVEIKDFGLTPLRKLQVGDYVKSGNDQYSQIYGFGHYDHVQEGTFLRILFDSSDWNNTLKIIPSSLEISPRHLVYVDANNTQKIIRASNVVVGDVLSGKRIKLIETVVRRGVYAPLTQSGDIIVSDILASNYVDVLDSWDQHTMGHFMFTPQRWYCYYSMETCKKEVYINGYGILAYLILFVSSIINYCQTIVRVYL